MRDIAVLSVEPESGRRLILRHGPKLYRIEVRPPSKSSTNDADAHWIPLLVTNKVGDAEAWEMADEGISFLDERGNAHLVLDGLPVVWARAAETTPPLARRNSARSIAPLERSAVPPILNRASHQVAFALLCAPEFAGESLRAIADTAVVSLGTVHKTLAHLTGAGFLLDGQLRDGGRLLTTWSDAYARLTFPQLTKRQLFATQQDWIKPLLLDPPPDLLLGGAAAAGLLTREFRASDGLVYTTDVGSAVRHLRLTPTPTPFAVGVRERFWGEGLPSQRVGLVPSVLVYGDLIREGDSRSLEAAADLRRTDAHLRALDRG